MTIDDIMAVFADRDGMLTLQPKPGDGTPEVAWGDVFFYYSPDGTVPRTQPFATIVTKDYPDDRCSQLNRPGTFRVNIFAGSAEFERRLGHTPKAQPPHEVDPSQTDTLIAHPVYGRMGWLAVVNPGPRTEHDVRELLRTAYENARARHDRHAQPMIIKGWRPHRGHNP